MRVEGEIVICPKCGGNLCFIGKWNKLEYKRQRKYIMHPSVFCPDGKCQEKVYINQMLNAGTYVALLWER